MPTYVAFLRAINLGATRKFSKDAIRVATEAAGGRDVETYINTGNVRLTHSARSVGKVQQLLEEAYAAEAGFEVPTIVFTAVDLAALTARAEELHAEHEPSGQHYVTLYAAPPGAAAVEAVHALAHAGETVVVDGRAAYVLLDGDIHTSKLLSSKEFNALGRGTARTVKVLRTVTGKWC
ncbi:Uncharacterized conserved protein, DUF1697 family [Nocardioides alpinus]|uniref:DUF1697 domain-containing protein n=1 Tax=Nocardioides alpinus TaxID=748909 RepID=A0A1I0V8N0_9ACTN|nr:DUF1697 domain-containing protein [Nocardioides alpinus]PKH37129.1 DUF1697 domain-containing protein [Nocardioides alpinus]SFA72695.1 Uncharacterized conserved protein, DUF1697 family [Nocardioides alpinus]